MKSLYPIIFCLVLISQSLFAQTSLAFKNSLSYSNNTSLQLFENSENSSQAFQENNLSKKSLIAGSIIVPAVVTGVLLKNENKPYNTFFFTAHKVTAVSQAVYVNYTLYNRMKSHTLSKYETGAAIVMIAGYLSSIITGALLSFDKPMPEWIKSVHQKAPWLSIISSAVLFYLFDNEK